MPFTARQIVYNEVAVAMVNTGEESVTRFKMGKEKGELRV